MLKEKIKGCKLCPLYESSPCGPVCGHGGKKGMLVCEKLSLTQAVTEVPFGCEDEDYIKNIIHKCGLNYRDYYYTSLVKCYSDEIKTEHVKMCKGWIDNEINERQIKKVICMGKNVSYRLIKELKSNCKMENIVGKVYEQDSVLYMPVYSLEFLKNYGLKKTKKVVETISGFLKE